MFVCLRGRGTNLLSGPVYPSAGVSVDVDQNQTLHRVWVCELEAERRKRQSYRRKTCCDRVRPAAWSTNHWRAIKAGWELWTDGDTHRELGEDVRSRSHAHSDYSTEADGGTKLDSYWHKQTEHSKQMLIFIFAWKHQSDTSRHLFPC